MDDVERAISAHVSAILESAVEEQRNKIPQHLAAVRSEYSAKGVLNSSMAHRAMALLIVNWFEALAKRTCDEIVRVYDVLGRPESEQLAPMLRRILSQELDRSHEAYLAIGRAPGTNPHDTFLGVLLSEIAAAKTRALARFGAELELYSAGVHAGQRPTSREGAIYNFQGPVGAVMTGAQAYASVTQTYTETHRTAVMSALESVDSLLATDAALAERRPELGKMVQEARAMAREDKPPPRLLGFLHGLAAAVEGVANGRGAYEAIQSALRVLGLG